MPRGESWFDFQLSFWLPFKIPWIIGPKVQYRLGDFSADVNAKDNYELSPFDRLASNSVVGNEALRKAGALEGRKLPSGVPEWKGAEYKYVGIGETSPILTRKNID